MTKDGISHGQPKEVVTRNSKKIEKGKKDNQPLSRGKQTLLAGFAKLPRHEF
jgi:hypothetical protein